MKKPINKKIIEALNNNDSIIVNAAQEIGCSRLSLRKWIDNDPELRAAELECIESLKDKVEYQLLKNIRAGKETSLIWFTKCRMADRGYRDQMYQDTNVNINQVRITYVNPDGTPLPQHQEQQNLPDTSNLITIKIQDNKDDQTSE